MTNAPSEDGEASAREQAHLEGAHHEICSALTVLRSNVELVRIELREDTDPGTRVAVHRHLTELDAAVDRLQRLAVAMKAWHSGARHGSARSSLPRRSLP